VTASRRATAPGEVGTQDHRVTACREPRRGGPGPALAFSGTIPEDVVTGLEEEKRMLRRLAVAAVTAAATVALAGPAAGQRPSDVTVLLKSGERVTGELALFDQTTVDIRGASGQRQTLQWSDIVLLDFVGGARSLSSTEVATAQPQHVIVLRGGEIRHGRVVDFVNEGSPRATMVFEAQGQGRQEIRLNQVQRIYVNAFTPEARAAAGISTGTQTGASSGSASGSLTGDGLTVTIPGNTRWMGTGIFVRSGERLSLQSEGTVYLRSGSTDAATPAGASDARRASGSELPGELAGALIGRVGPQGEAFGIGDQSNISMPESGELFLGINDDELSDNSGQFTVRIRRPQQRIPR
jgi:hypothetical protein